MGTIFPSLELYFLTFFRFSGMRGLPALIWDGSVLDAGVLL